MSPLRLAVFAGLPGGGVSKRNLKDQYAADRAHHIIIGILVVNLEFEMKLRVCNRHT